MGGWTRLLPRFVGILVALAGLLLASPVLAESPAPTSGTTESLGDAVSLVDVIGRNIFTLIAGVIVVVLLYGLPKWNLTSNYKLAVVALVLGLVAMQLVATYNSDKGQRAILEKQIAAQYDTRLRECRQTLRSVRQLIVGKLQHPESVEVVKALADQMLIEVDSATECIDLQQSANPSPGPTDVPVTEAPGSDLSSP